MLHWQKLGPRTWYGEDRWLCYHIEHQGKKYALARGGIANKNWWAFALTLQGAKDAAQIDATKREDKLLFIT